VFLKQSHPACMRFCVMSFLALSTCVSCQVGQWWGATASPVASAEKPLEEIAGEPYPFTFRVLNEVNDGSKLHVRGEVLSKRDWDGRLLALRILSLNNGEVVDRQEFPFLEVATEKQASPELRAATPYQFLVSSTAEGVTDYQIDLVWGEDARAMFGAEKQQALPTTETLPPALAPQESPLLTVKNLEILREHRNCDSQPCLMSYELLVNIENSGSSIVNSAVLELGLVPSDQDLPAAGDLVSSQELEVTGLGLEPAATRSIRVNYEETPSQASGQPMRPQLRVLSAAQ
jgi:hypothetical protein